MTSCCTRTAARAIRGTSPPEEGAATSNSFQGPACYRQVGVAATDGMGSSPIAGSKFIKGFRTLPRCRLRRWQHPGSTAQRLFQRQFGRTIESTPLVSICWWTRRESNPGVWSVVWLSPQRNQLKGPLPNSSTHLADPLQDNDRNDSLCLLRVVAESPEHIAMRLVETIALDSLRNRRCAHLELLRAHLNLGRAILHQIMIPAGMCRRAALRRRDDVAFTVTVVDERRRAQLAAFGPARREEQEVVAPRSDAFSALRVEVVNNASVPIRHALTNALEDCAIPVPAAERSACGLISRSTVQDELMPEHWHVKGEGCPGVVDPWAPGQGTQGR